VRWRVGVETELGVRGFGVLVAPAGRRWRARIVTFPNVLWMVPGGGEPLKLLARSETDAIRRAVDFIRCHCVQKGYLMRDELVPVAPPRPRMGSFRDAPPSIGGAIREPRFDRRLPVRFGRSRPTILGRTGNLSESGLFVATETPLSSGELAGLALELEHCKVPLRGSVAWHCALRTPERERGMGLRLVNPPAVYVRYVRALS
jgi:hypothetical protein